MITVYGIKTCDTCRKALKWLDEKGIAHRFHDYRKDGADAALIDDFIARFGAENLFNKSSKTWRGFSESERAKAQAGNGRDLLLRDPTVIKRPIFLAGDISAIGFKDKERDMLTTLHHGS